MTDDPTSTPSREVRATPVDTATPTSFELRGYDPETQADRTYRFTGRVLADATSHSAHHVRLVHGDDRHAPPGERCSACRWFEVRIYTTAATPRVWYVETVGRTTVPGELDRRRVRRVEEPRRVVATLVQQRQGDAFIPQVSRRALDAAADRDPDLAAVVDDLLVF